MYFFFFIYDNKMVKIIRLTTQSEDGSFETRFNSPVNVKANAKLALQNLIMAVQKNEIVVDSTNDGMTFQVSGGNIRNAIITRGTYDKTSAGEDGLLKNIMEGLNAALVYQSGKELGAQWKVSVNTRINIENAFSKGGNYGPTFNTNIPTLAGNPVITISTPNNANYIVSQDVSQAATTNNSCFTFLDTPICKGVGSWRAKIHTLNDEATDQSSGFIIGLSTKEPSTFAPKGVVSATSFDTNDIYWGIKVNKLASNYSIINEGVSVATIQGVGYVGAGNANNDILDINMNEGKLKATIWYNGGSVLLSEKTSNNNGSEVDFSRKDLYPFIIFRAANANAKAHQVRFYQDPFEPNPSVEASDDHLGAPAPPTQRGSKNLTQQFIQFNSIELARQIGYEPNRYPSSGTLLLANIKWVADLDYDILSINDSYQVIMDNVYLEGYDSLTKGQKNILFICEAKDDIGAIRYDANFPVFVDANNREAISLKNIKIRVLRADGSQVNSHGLSTATILVQD